MSMYSSLNVLSSQFYSSPGLLSVSLLDGLADRVHRSIPDGYHCDGDCHSLSIPRAGEDESPAI